MLSEFILNSILESYAMSKELGQEKYNAYFVDTQIYNRFKDEVDSCIENRI